MSLIGAIIALGFLIFVHELGHFLVAKMFSVQVLEFAIGFGPKLFSARYGETDYSLRAIPLGGYVKMAGETPFELETELEKAAAEVAEHEEKKDEERDPRITDDQSRWFLSQGFVPKFFIVFAGPAFNILFAILLSWGVIYIFGDPDYLKSTQIGEVMPDLPAAQAGLKSGDVVLKVGGIETKTWDELATAIRSSGGEAVDLEVRRQDEILHLELTPTIEQTEIDNLLDNEVKRYKIGIYPATARVAVGVWKAGYLAVKQVYWISNLTIRGLIGMVQGKVSANNIAGPIEIFKQGAKAANVGIDRLAEFMVFLSVSLALLNLLPIPVLDGGHLLFFIIEAIKGSPVSTTIQERATQAGMLALLCLMIFALSNDVRRFLE